jgi:hypothetical protein
MTRQFVDEISPRLALMGLALEVSDKASNANFDKALPQDLAASPAVALAAAWVRSEEASPEFLPPKVQPWQQWMSKGLSARKLIWVGEAAAAVVACVILAFGYQQWQLQTLRGQWGHEAPRVAELNGMQDQIAQFRDYYDQAARSVGIWAKLAAIFPRDNSVSLKTLEVRDQGLVTCSGVARDNDSFVKVFGKLSDDTNNISNVHPEVRGQKPMQFTLSFQWQGGGISGN